MKSKKIILILYLCLSLAFVFPLADSVSNANTITAKSSSMSTSISTSDGSSSPTSADLANPSIDLAPHAKSAILMDMDTGTIMYEKNSDEKLPPASITKVMSMLLIMEALEKGTIDLKEKVRASEYAASMGGSQIFLEAGEEMTVDELLKGIAMASGNDATVALAERIAGSEELFVQMMNDKAKELGLKNTHFRNSNGLPDEDHYSTAHDIAMMSKHLLKYDQITNYTSKYQDYLRKNTEDPFWLVNTNKLVRFYQGADGLKTGYTSEAKFCLAATAKRNDMRIIAVVMGEPNSKTRNAEVGQMFNFAFSQYANYTIFKKGDAIEEIPIEKGKEVKLALTAQQPYSILLKKGEEKGNIRHEVNVDSNLKAPIKQGDQIGELFVYRDNKLMTKFPLYAQQSIDKASWWTLFKRTSGKLFIH